MIRHILILHSLKIPPTLFLSHFFLGVTHSTTHQVLHSSHNFPSPPIALSSASDQKVATHLFFSSKFYLAPGASFFLIFWSDSDKNFYLPLFICLTSHSPHNRLLSQVIQSYFTEKKNHCLALYHPLFFLLCPQDCWVYRLQPVTQFSSRPSSEQNLSPPFLWNHS